MSAATDGHQLPYVVTPPKASELSGIRAGGYLQQKKDICYVSNRAGSAWIVKKLTDNQVTICPIKPRRIRSQRTVFRRPILATEYRAHPTRGRC